MSISKISPEYFSFDKMHPSTNIQVCTLLSQTSYFHISFPPTLLDLVSSWLNRLLSFQLLSAAVHIALILLLHSSCFSWSPQQMILQVPLQNKSSRCACTASRNIQSPYWLRPHGMQCNYYGNMSGFVCWLICFNCIYSLFLLFIFLDIIGFCFFILFGSN